VTQSDWFHFTSWERYHVFAFLQVRRFPAPLIRRAPDRQQPGKAQEIAADRDRAVHETNPGSMP